MPENLEGRVVESFEELQKLIPENQYYGEVFLSEPAEYRNIHDPGMDIYAREEIKRIVRNVAYGCKRDFCKKIVIGYPIAEAKNESMGNININYKCGECKFSLN